MRKIDFSKKHVLISGGSSGIGLALARQFAALGAHVTILARDRKKLEHAEQDIVRYKSNPTQEIASISADVQDYKKLQEILSAPRKKVDILINSAGIAYPGEFEKLDQEIFASVMDTNYLGTINLTKIIVPEMIDTQWGYIVNLSSLAAVIGIYGYTAYAPSKYAIRGFSRCLRSEMVPKGINVSVVLPPDTDTPQLAFEHALLPEITRKINQNGGVLSAEKVANVIINGMHRRKFTIIPGIEGKLLYLLAPFFGRYFYRFAIKQKVD
jgi:3-dehydrosphinganine reductase